MSKTKIFHNIQKVLYFPSPKKKIKIKKEIFGENKKCFENVNIFSENNIIRWKVSQSCHSTTLQ
jgi:hypothetical protein